MILSFYRLTKIALDGFVKPRKIMKNYIGVKEIKAKPMTKKEYCEYRDLDVPENEDPNEEVYLVEYPEDENSKPNHPNHKGYISMSPKHVFDKAYRKTDGLTFGLAVEALKLGYCVARSGWNGKGMFIYKALPNTVLSDIIPKMTSLPDSAKKLLEGLELDFENGMTIVNSTGRADSWVASSSDTFAEDWYIIK